jgi:hypothetical protein
MPQQKRHTRSVIFKKQNYFQEAFRKKIGMILAWTGHTNFNTKNLMKTLKLPILGFALVLTAASCKKSDFKEDGSVAPSTTASSINEADTVGWKPAAIWETADQETFSVHYFTIEDATITNDVADNGLVLLFKRNGNAINSLPFEEGDTHDGMNADAENSQSKYWYHQVAAGNLLVSCDAYGNDKTPDGASSFKYFVITPQMLQRLEADGYTTEKLMNLNYAEAASLLKATE